MRKKTRWIWFVIIVVFVIVALAVYVKSLNFDTTLAFSVRDNVSKEWVWDSTITLQDREIRGFFGKEFVFTHLKPGKAVLKIEAPNYVSQELQINLKKGKNKLEKPIDLIGYEIPNLDHFIVFTDNKPEGIALEIRPVGKDKKAVLNHPCLDIRLICRVSEQIKNGVLVTAPTDSGSERGKELFRGFVKWNWDPTPETIFRYSATVPYSSIKKSEASYWVLDYLFIVPDPRKINNADYEEVIKKILSFKSHDELMKYLDSLKGKIRYFIDTSWNVKAQGK